MDLETLVKRDHGPRIFHSAAALALSAFLAVTSATSLGCGQSADSGKAPGISEQLQDAWPIWQPEDLELNKYKGMIIQYDHELNLRPAFYKGKMPLHYVSQQTPGAGMMSGTERFLKHEFDGFSNYFIYDGVALEGMVAVDKSNKMVAEARISYGQYDGRMKVLMEEFHYSEGLLVYHCLSQVDHAKGAKIAESEKSGRKKRDYFFILPIGINQ